MSENPETTVSQETKALVLWGPTTAQGSQAVSIPITHPGERPDPPRVPGLLTFMTNADNTSYCFLTADSSVLSLDPRPDADPSATIRPKIPVESASADLADTLDLTEGLILSDEGVVRVDPSVYPFSEGDSGNTLAKMLLLPSVPKLCTLDQLDLQPTNKVETLDTAEICGKDPLSFQGVMLSDFKTHPKPNGDGPNENPTATCTAKWIFVKQAEVALD